MVTPESVGTERRDFDDREVARTALASLRSNSGMHRARSGSAA